MPNENETEKEQQEKQPFFSAVWEETKSAFCSKKAWMILVFFLVLLVIGGLVPVGKIPFLRNLAYAMGYTPDETEKISLLRALFSWNEHQKILRGELPDPDAVSVFGEGGGFLAASAAPAQNKLINLRAVNDSLARKGQAQDALSMFSSTGNMGEDARPSNIKIGNTTVSATTRADAAKTGEVFFGADASAVVRDKTHGYDSIGALKKIANPNITGAVSDDWMGRLVDKATRSDSGLANIAKNIDKGGTLTGFGGVQELGQSRAQRDMYHAWLYGKAARRTPNPILKKTLASASFDSVEMPRSVFSASGFSGVGINPDDVVADMDSVKKYLELDQTCQQAISQVGDAVGQLKSDIYTMVKGLRFPATCEEAAGSNYGSQLSTITEKCLSIRSQYTNNLDESCNIRGTQGSCSTETLSGRFNEYRAYCNEAQAQCNLLTDPAQQAACRSDIKTAENFTGETFCDPNCGSAAVSKDTQNTFNVDENGDPVDRDDDRNISPFTPGLDMNSGFWVGNAD